MLAMPVVIRAIVRASLRAISGGIRCRYHVTSATVPPAQVARNLRIHSALRWIAFAVPMSWRT